MVKVFKNSPNKSKEILEALKETLSSSSIHSLPNITNNRFVVIKIIWLLCLIISTGFCCWMIAKTINDYLNFDVISQIDIEYRNEMVFPIVSICNINLFTTELASQFVSFVLGTTMPDFTEGPINRAQTLAKLHAQRNFFGRSIDETIISCRFNAAPCSIAEDFEYFYDVNYGNCFRFNSGRNLNGNKTSLKYQYRKGFTNALKLELYVGAAVDNNNLLSVENGFVIFINNETLDSTAYEGIRVSNGFSTNIILEKYTLKHLPVPYSSCVANLVSPSSYSSECYKKTISSNKTYHFTDCANLCALKSLGDICGCQSSYFDLVYYTNMTDCYTSYNMSLCLFNHYQEFTHNPKYLKECDCPLECYKYGYASSFSLAEYPTKKYSTYLFQKNKLIRSIYKNESTQTYDNLKQSILKVNVFYDELKETIITHNAKMIVTDLVSSIGGTLGLFMGVSFLSLVELVEIVIQTLIISFKHKH